MLRRGGRHLVQDGGDSLLVLSPPVLSALVFPKPVPLHRAPLALRLTRPFPTALSPGRSPEKTDAECPGDDKRVNDFCRAALVFSACFGDLLIIEMF